MSVRTSGDSPAVADLRVEPQAAGSSSRAAQSQEPTAETGEMAHLIAVKDWSQTPLGPQAKWPVSLRTAVNIALASQYPTVIFWGPELRMLYNDAYLPILGAERKALALGERAEAIAAAVWDVARPLLESALAGRANFAEDLRMDLTRGGGRPTESYVTFSYTPLTGDDGRVSGIFCPIVETTPKIIGARRLRALRDLAACSCDGEAQLLEQVARTLGRFPEDMPFALVYLTRQDGHLVRACSAGLQAGATVPDDMDPADGANAWPVEAVLRTNAALDVELSGCRWAPAAGARAPEAARFEPLRAPLSPSPAGVIVFGLSPRLRVDSEYHAYLGQVAAQIGTLLAAARSRADLIRYASSAGVFDPEHVQLLEALGGDLSCTLDALAHARRRREVEEARERAEAELAADLEALTRMHALSGRVVEATGLEKLLQEAIDTAVAIMHADKGTLQLLEGDALRILAHHGHEQPFLDYFAAAESVASVCGEATRQGERVVVPDVEQSPLFAGTSSLPVLRAAGVRAVQSTPMLTGAGLPVGILTTHWRAPHTPDEHDLWRLDLLARQTAALIEQKQGEESLRRSEARFRSFFETPAVGTAELSLDGRLLAVNDRYCEITGYSRQELLGMPVANLSVPEAAEHDREELFEQLQGDCASYRLIKRFRRKDGRVIWVQVDAGKVCGASGRLSHVAGTLQDITESKRAEEALREAERRYRELVRLAPAGIYEVDFRTRRFTSVNDAMLEILGYSREELLAMSPFGILDEESQTRFRERLTGWLAGERPEPSVEYKVKTKDGRTIDGLLAVSFTKDQHGRPLGATVVAHDITERKRVERALQQSREALREANDRLLEADRRKNEFLAVLSHELRNPLAPIANSLYILDHAQPGGEQAERAKQVIGRQVGQLSNLVNDLLDVTRITSNKVQLQKERLELCDVVRRAIEDNRSFFERAGVHVELALASRPVPVIADRTRVAQIVGNLLQNSAKFTGRGGRTRVSVAAETNEAVVSVADNGVGIARETLERLFQPFMQAEQTLDRSKGGLGLGLALVKGLVELHGGSVSAHSEGLGHGAEVAVRLPLDSGAALDVSADSERVARARRRVLIIEDNIEAADSLSEALEFGDHEVAVAYNGPEGIARARQFRPDVVLCDIGLPGMDGYEVARAFRADEALAGTFLVALSGYALPEDLQRAAEAGFQRHLPKPPALEKLEHLLAEAPRAPSHDGSAADVRPPV